MKSDNHLFDKLPFGGYCPNCDHTPVTFYYTDSGMKRGKYKCPKCNRDTVWAMGKAESAADVIKRLWVE